MKKEGRKSTRSTRVCIQDSALKIHSCKRSQMMSLPFSTIFSIILIIFFIVVAIIAIFIFINPEECAFSDQASEGLFKQDLQDLVNDAWNSDRTDTGKEFNLPAKIDYVCFLDFSKSKKGNFASFYDDLTLWGEGNMYLYPGKKACDGFRSMTIQHINISEMTKKDNPYCKENKNGKVSLRIEKGFYDFLVKIS